MCATAAQGQQEKRQQEQQGGEQQQQSSPPDPPAARQQLAADALSAQFQAQLEALTAISLGQVAPDSLVLAACGGRIPPAAVSVLSLPPRALPPALQRMPPLPASAFAVLLWCCAQLGCLYLICR